MGTTDNDRFDEIKQEILRRAKEAQACKGEYGRAYSAGDSAGDMAELMRVVKDNFAWCCNNKVLTADLFERYNEELAAHDIFCNVNVESGYLLACGSSKVTAYDRSEVTAYDRSEVTAWDSSKVTACGSSKVTAWDSSEVTACGSSEVTAWDSSEVTACGSSKVTACGSSKVTAWDSSEVTAYDSSKVTAWDSSKVTAWDSSEVTAYGGSYVVSRGVMECKLSGKAINRVVSTGEIRYASNELRPVKVEPAV